MCNNVTWLKVQLTPSLVTKEACGGLVIQSNVWLLSQHSTVSNVCVIYWVEGLPSRLCEALSNLASVMLAHNSMTATIVDQDCGEIGVKT